jgi:hypothetical protein
VSWVPRRCQETHLRSWTQQLAVECEQTLLVREEDLSGGSMRLPPCNEGVTHAVSRDGVKNDRLRGGHELKLVDLQHHLGSSSARTKRPKNIRLIACRS